MMRRTFSFGVAALLALAALLSVPPVHRLHAQGYSTPSYQVIPTCVYTPTTTAAAAGYPKTVFVTAGQTTVSSYLTNSTAGTVEVTCTFPVPILAGSNLTLTGLDVNYDIITTTLTTFANPTFNSLTIPATAGGAATGTVATTAGGTLTFLPATIQKTAVTQGLVYRLNISLGTPVALTSAIASYAVDFVLTTAGGAATGIDLYPFTLYVK